MTEKKVDAQDKSQQDVNAIDPIPDEISEGKAVPSKQLQPFILGGYVIIIVLGIATGHLLSKSSGGIAVMTKPGAMVRTGKVAGIADTKTFKDFAEGTVEKGGLNGEGTHKLIRDGGPSQTVYLISSAVDLDEYVGKKVKVWGQTMAAKKAAWLMDVGKIEQ